jgi:hypothetical protein
LETAKKILNQKRSNSGEIYSLHAPEVYCVSKGKEHKKYEFGAKGSVVVDKNVGVILGACSLSENDYDGHALEPTLEQVEQVERVAGYRSAVAIGDKGFRGQSHCGETEVVTPGRGKKNASAYEKGKARSRFRQRAAIEPRIGRLKSDFRLNRNFLKGRIAVRLWWRSSLGINEGAFFHSAGGEERLKTKSPQAVASLPPCTGKRMLASSRFPPNHRHILFIEPDNVRRKTHADDAAVSCRPAGVAVRDISPVSAW